MNNIPLYVHKTFTLYLHLSLGHSLGCFHAWLLWIMLKWIQKYICLLERVVSFSSATYLELGLLHHQFSSVTQSCPTLCNPMDCSMPGFPVHHQLLELAQTSPSSQCCHPTISSSAIPFTSCLQSFPASGSSPMSQFFASGGQSIGVSASASVLPMNIQGWFVLGQTGLISLKSKGLSRVFSNKTVKSINYLVLSFLYSPIHTCICDDWKNNSFD